MKIPFVKMHGLGNDFIIFDNIKNPIIHDSKFINKISNRRIGIGCDQVLIIEDTNNPQIFEVNIYNKSEEFFCLAVQGPESLRLLRQYFNLSITPFKLIKSDNLIISGTGYTGEKGYEIMGPISESQEIWESFLEMGAIPIGLGARDTLRLEKGYLLSGTDFNGSQTTLESGYSWVIDWNHDFIGKEKLLLQKKREVSELTSGALSPILKRGIGLSYLDLPIGTTVNVSIRNKQLKGRVIQTPFL